MPSDCFSLKMRASREGNHISGAEKILPESVISPHLQALLERAMHHANGEPDFVNFKLERIPADSILHLDALPVRSLTADTPGRIGVDARSARFARGQSRKGNCRTSQ